MQTYSYWLMKQLFGDDGSQLARAVGFYKMVQSLGWCVGFALTPTSRLPPLLQCVVTAASAAAGTALALRVLPAARAADSRAEPLLHEAAGGTASAAT